MDKTDRECGHDVTDPEEWSKEDSENWAEFEAECVKLGKDRSEEAGKYSAKTKAKKDFLNLSPNKPERPCQECNNAINEKEQAVEHVSDTVWEHAQEVAKWDNNRW